MIPVLFDGNGNAIKSAPGFFPAFLANLIVQTHATIF